MPIVFRNVDGSPADDVRDRPYEGCVTTIDRGLVSDWRPLFTEILSSPWGEVARRVKRHLSRRESDGVSTLFAPAPEHFRTAAEAVDRAEVAARIRRAVDDSGLTDADLARLVVTSGSRLSTYLSGKVVPPAAMLVRIELTASDNRVRSQGDRGTDGPRQPDAVPDRSGPWPPPEGR